MIKLQTTALTHLPLSNFNLLNNILTVDTKQFDLRKPESIPEDQESPIYRFEENIIIKLNIPQKRMFLFQHGNLLRFFDTNLNGIIEISELVRPFEYIQEKDDKIVMDWLRVEKKKFKDATGKTEKEAERLFISKGKPS